MSRLLAYLAVLLLPCIAAAEIIDTAGAKPGTYVLVVNADGSATVTYSGPSRPVRLKDLGTGGPTNPPPPVESALSRSVRQLTASALAKGGSPVTAANIAAIYSLVSDDCSAGKAGLPRLASQLIVAATDEVLTDATAGERDVWKEWRDAVGPLLGAVPGIGADKDATAKALDEVATGVQAAINSAAVAEPGILDGINWERIREILKPILEQLLKRLLDELLKKLPL